MGDKMSAWFEEQTDVRIGVAKSADVWETIEKCVHMIGANGDPNMKSDDIAKLIEMCDKIANHSFTDRTLKWCTRYIAKQKLGETVAGII